MSTPPFVSDLHTGPARFLAEVIDHSLRIGRRSALDFIRHFPPAAIMAALEPAPQTRAVFLTTLLGMKPKTALRTPAEDAGRMLQAALEEQDCDAAAIVEAFKVDDRVRALDAGSLWGFLMEGDFWRVSRSKDTAGHKVAEAHIAFMLDRGLAHRLLSHLDIVEHLTVAVLADKLPRAELAKMVKGALALGRDATPFTDRDLYAAVPSQVLAEHIALSAIMDGVIVPMAEAAGYVQGPSSSILDRPLSEWPAVE